MTRVRGCGYMSMLGIGLPELLIIGFFAFLLFGGPSKLPAFFRALGRAQGEFMMGRREVEEEMKEKFEKKEKL